MKALHKLIAILLCLGMLLVFAGCGVTQPGKNTDPTDSEKGTAGNEAPPAHVEGPVTITIWHNRGAGANLDALRRAIEAFNASNEYGIVVEEEYVGGYATVLSKTAAAVAGKNNPTMVLLHSAGIASLADKGCFADMTPYVERDQFNVDNYIESLMHYSYYGGKLISVPYVASVCMLAYNKDLLKAAGYTEPPKTIAELKEIGAKIHNTTGAYGFGMYISSDYFVDALVHDLGGVGILGDDNSTECLTNGSLLTVMQDWRSWIDAGWCKEPNVTSGQTLMVQDFQNGKVAMMAYSSGGMADVISYAESTGKNLDFGYLPGYNGPATNIGGGNLAILSANHSQQEVAAAWEFIKFISQDEWVIDNAVGTGYLPVTYSSAEDAGLQSFWQEHLWHKRAYEQLAWANASAFSQSIEEWRNAVNNALSYVVQDGTMSPEDAVSYLKRQATVIFYD